MKKPSEQQLSSWVNGDLLAKELSEVEAWASQFPDEASQAVEGLMDDSLLKDHIHASIEPPHVDFFHSKLAQKIQQEQEVAKSELNPKSSMFTLLFRWFAAPAALGLMVMCFFLGVQYQAGSKEVNLVYVPSDEVTVTQYETSEATMILLDGLEPVSDDFFKKITMIHDEKPFTTVSAKSGDNNYF